MKTFNISSIQERLDPLGTQNGDRYSNQEIVEKLSALEGAMTDEIVCAFKDSDTEPRFLSRTLDRIATRYGFVNEPFYSRLSQNVKRMGFNIAGSKKGLKGEEDCMKALSFLTRDPDIEILYNINLPDDCLSEYDAVILAPYGMFFIEVKNWAGKITITEQGTMEKQFPDGYYRSYGLGERMNAKEYTLRKYIPDYDTIPHAGYLLIMDKTATVEDHFLQVPVSYRNTIVNDIRSNRKDDADDNLMLSKERILEIKQILLENNSERRFPCHVDCEAIKEDFALVMERIQSVRSQDELEGNAVVNYDSAELQKSETRKTRSMFNTSAGYMAAATIISVIASVIYNQMRGRIA